MRVALRCCALALSVLLSNVPALAQETTGQLEGRVLDAKGEPIPDVNVSVTSPALQGGRGCLTTARGTFVLLALPIGEYTVKLQHLAYQAQVFEKVRVRLAQTATLGDVRLADAVLSQPEVVVKTERPLIDPRSTGTGGVLDAREYSALPIERDYRSVATLLPQVNASYLGDPMNVAGSTGLDNHFTVDGIDVTEPVRGATGTALPYNFVQEVEVRAGGYEAEYRSALGGVVNAITYSGGNAASRTAFGYYTRNRPTADPRYVFAKNPGDFALYDVGLGVGGPVVRDRLWYYVAYNPTFTRDDVLIPRVGRRMDRTTTHRFASKLTWRASDANSFVLTVLGDPTRREGVGASWGNWGAMQTALNPEVWLEDIHSGSLAGRVEGRHLLGRSAVLRSSLSWTRFLDYNMPAAATNEGLFIDEQTATWSGGSPDRVDNRSDEMIAGLKGTWSLGAHEVKAGGEYKDSEWKADFWGGRTIAHADGSYDLFISSMRGTVRNRIPSAFAQDSWRIGDRLRVNAGLRWDGLYIVSSEGRVAQSILDQWQPRGGIVWQPSAHGVDKVTASAGRFYHDLATWPLVFYFSTGSFNADYIFDHDPRIDPTGGVPLFELKGAIQPRIQSLKGQYYDEYALGYERQVGARTKVGLHGTLRILGQALEDGQDPNTEIYYWANPGSGPLSMYPRAERRYSGLELSLSHAAGDRLSVSGSYVLSRTHGNYPGLFNSDYNFPFPTNGSFDVISIMDKSIGLLPNDRTHVAKLVGRYETVIGVTVGVVGAWESGTPLSEFGWGPWLPVFLSPRGTAGRTPAIWDLSARIGYKLPSPSTTRARPRVTLDLMHIGSPRKPVTYDMLHYFAVDGAGNPTTPNPNYRQPTQYQPGFAVRVGTDVAF